MTKPHPSSAGNNTTPALLREGGQPPRDSMSNQTPTFSPHPCQTPAAGGWSSEHNRPPFPTRWASEEGPTTGSRELTLSLSLVIPSHSRVSFSAQAPPPLPPPPPPPKRVASSRSRVSTLKAAGPLIRGWREPRSCPRLGSGRAVSEARKPRKSDNPMRSAGTTPGQPWRPHACL